MTDAQRYLTRLRDCLDVNVFTAVIGLAIHETTTMIDALKSRRAFGHAIDASKLDRLETYRQELIDGAQTQS